MKNTLLLIACFAFLLGGTIAKDNIIRPAARVSFTIKETDRSFDVTAMDDQDHFELAIKLINDYCNQNCLTLKNGIEKTITLKGGAVCFVKVSNGHLSIHCDKHLNSKSSLNTVKSMCSKLNDLITG